MAAPNKSPISAIDRSLGMVDPRPFIRPLRYGEMSNPEITNWDRRASPFERAGLGGDARARSRV